MEWGRVIYLNVLGEIQTYIESGNAVFGLQKLNGS